MHFTSISLLTAQKDNTIFYLHRQIDTNKPFLDFADYLYFFFNDLLKNHN